MTQGRQKEDDPHTDNPPLNAFSAIDVGGTGLKAAIIAPQRQVHRAKRLRVKTPKHRTPREDRARRWPSWWRRLGKFDHVTIGFPGDGEATAR